MSEGLVFDAFISVEEYPTASGPTAANRSKGSLNLPVNHQLWLMGVVMVMELFQSLGRGIAFCSH